MGSGFALVFAIQAVSYLSVAFSLPAVPVSVSFYRMFRHCRLEHHLDHGGILEEDLAGPAGRENQGQLCPAFLMAGICTICAIFLSLRVQGDDDK
jgi:hypothetical protein